MNFVCKVVLVSLAALLAVSCSKGNDNTSLIDPATGKHVAGWAVASTGGTHPAAFLADVNVCFECHGTDLRGGASKVSCFTASRSGITCHADGPPAPHNVPFPAHGDTAAGNFNFCLICHKDVLSPGSIPPGCQNCHLTSPIATPSGCTSCHAKPPNSAVFPNISGRHSIHASLNVTQNATQTAVCDECHRGRGFGTFNHQSTAQLRSTTIQATPVAFGTLASTGGLLPAYNTATKQCDNTYCHGNNLDKTSGSEILSPRWSQRFLTGVATNDCVKCHGYPPLTVAHQNAGVPSSPVNGCKTCHFHVNAAGTGFDDPTKHINGVINLSQ